MEYGSKIYVIPIFCHFEFSNLYEDILIIDGPVQ